MGRGCKKDAKHWGKCESKNPFKEKTPAWFESRWGIGPKEGGVRGEQLASGEKRRKGKGAVGVGGFFQGECPPYHYGSFGKRGLKKSLPKFALKGGEKDKKERLERLKNKRWRGNKTRMR